MVTRACARISIDRSTTSLSDRGARWQPCRPRPGLRPPSMVQAAPSSLEPELSPISDALPFPGFARYATQLAAGTICVAGLMMAGCAAPSTLTPGSVGSLGASPSKRPPPGAETRWTCAALENAIAAQVTKIAALKLKAKAELAAPPPTVEAMFTRLTGPPGAGSAVAREISTERKTADGYNELQGQKGCARTDIDAKIAGAPPPAPASPADTKNSARSRGAPAR